MKIRRGLAAAMSPLRGKPSVLLLLSSMQNQSRNTSGNLPVLQTDVRLRHIPVSFRHSSTLWDLSKPSRTGRFDDTAHGCSPVVDLSRLDSTF